MRRPLQVPILHLYRHLLREASYLPPLCQRFAKDQICTRFHKHRHDRVTDPATKERVRRARHHLRYLWAANHGLLDNMLRILLLAFGRVGRRRRELIHDLVLRKETPADSAELARQIEVEKGRQQEPKKLPPDWLDRWDLPKLHALAASQSQRSFWSPKPDVRWKKLNAEDDLPKENTWGRPLAAKLKRSKLRKWYKRLINRIMPPVSRSEWETLGLLATGRAEKSLWQMPTRRPSAQLLNGGDGDATGRHPKVWDWKAYATKPVRSIERGSSRSQKARTGEEGEAPYGLGSPLGLHSYNRSRVWERLYLKVWAMTPIIEEATGQKGKWRIQWGQVRRQYPVAMPTQTAFFIETESRSKKKGKINKKA